MACSLQVPTIWDHLKNFRVWVHGISAACIGGAATALGAHFTDPSHVDFSSAGLHAMWKVALAGGFLTSAAYLTRSPLPTSCSQEVTHG